MSRRRPPFKALARLPRDFEGRAGWRRAGCAAVTEAPTYLGYGIVNNKNHQNPDIVEVTTAWPSGDDLMQTVLERTVKCRLSVNS